MHTSSPILIDIDQEIDESANVESTLSEHEVCRKYNIDREN